MKHLSPFLWLLLGAAATVVIFNLLRECSPHKTYTDSNQLRTVIKDTLKIRYHDTIYWEKIHKRRVSDSIRIWLQTNPEWDTICQSIGFGKGQAVDCKGVLLSRYHGYKSDSIIMAVYQRQRDRDSFAIEKLLLLDSINVIKIGVLTEENRAIVEAGKKERKRKRIYKALTVLGIIGIIVK